jgi:hypothetical protein
MEEAEPAIERQILSPIHLRDGNEGHHQGHQRYTVHDSSPTPNFVATFEEPALPFSECLCGWKCRFL